jgi:hypothetical protein
MSSATKDDQSRVGVRTDGVDLDRLPMGCVPEPPNDHYGPLLRQRSYPRPSMPDVVIENPVINSPFVRAPARSDSARSRQDIAFHLHGPESGARCSRIADLGRWGGGAHDHLDAMNTGVSASCELYGQVTSRMRSNAAVRFGWLLAGARVTTVAAVRHVKDLLGP